MHKYFDLVVGATEDSSRIKKDEILSYAISCIKDITISESIMIGDRASDIKAGLKHHMDTIGVLYGMDNRDILQDTGATYIAENVDQIMEILGR